MTIDWAAPIMGRTAEDLEAAALQEWARFFGKPGMPIDRDVDIHIRIDGHTVVGVAGGGGEVVGYEATASWRGSA